MLSASDIRRRYLDFFRARGHTVIPSASLIPEGDSTLLFVNSGMFPLVPYLLGEKHPGGVRLADSQKSFRAGDIEEVGDNRHNTFFEMLGNWSLGDYFKREQLAWWYEFLVEDLKLDPRRLYQTVYGGSEVAPKDGEAVSIIKEVFAKYGITATEGPATTGAGSAGPGVPIDFSGSDRIFAYVDKNWWQRGEAVGELGGPDSETFYDMGKPHDPRFGEYCHLNCDCGRFIEIGNSVFMQYQRAESGWKELPKKNVDFGGGLERIAMVVEGTDNIFETDLFLPIIQKIEELAGKKYRDAMRPFEIIADHLKAAAFIMSDDRGIAPSNVGQGYIVRRLIRRALRYGKLLGIAAGRWTPQIAREVVGIYADEYGELARNEARVASELAREEERFGALLERGVREFEKRTSGEKAVDGETAFDLYQTFGFPIEMVEELARERGMQVDRAAFDERVREHQALSRTASAGMFRGGLADQSERTTKLHTATHLLQAALRETLGAHVEQKGSNITGERLRFDFSHEAKLTDEEIARVEARVNELIGQDLPVHCVELPLAEAERTGALHVFGEKYPPVVKVHYVGDSIESAVSKEFCGGPHAERTGGLGVFKITKEEAVSQGVRRIKAILS